MKKRFFSLLFSFAFLSYIQAQSFSAWINYSFSQRVSGIDFNGNDIWISTQGGLVKYNKKTAEKTYYNRANSNLPDNNLIGLFVNTNDEVWIGGKYYGIGKFNGKQCIIYNESNSGLPFDQANGHIKIDKNGNLWIASFRWMARFDGTNWKSWKTGSDISAFPIISDFIIDNKGVVWLCSTDGLGKIENDEYSVIPGLYGGTNQCMAFDNNMGIWIGIEGGGLYQYTGSTFTNYTTSNSCLPTNLIYSISFDSNNIMWLGTTEGLVKFNISTCVIYKPSQTEKALLRVKAADNDTIWCGSLSGKLLCFNGKDFTSIDLSNSPLKNNYINDILVDNSNNTWIGTKQNLVKKSGNPVLSLFDRSTYALAKDNTGAVWAAFGAGDTCLLKMSANDTTLFNSNNSPFNSDSTTITSMVVDNNNNLWISSISHGLYKYDGHTFTNYTPDNSAIPAIRISTLIVDKDNNLWGGSVKGLFKYNGSTFTVWDTTNSSIPTNVVIGLAFDAENNLWFSCMDKDRIIGCDYGGGLTCFDGKTMITYNKSNSGLQCNTILDVCVDSNDKIWLATCGAGLVHFDKGVEWVSYNVTNSGIANNIVQKIKQDKTGNLWLGHIDAGISVFNPDSGMGVIEQENNKGAFRNNPNPFKHQTTITFTIVENNSTVTLKVFDIRGNQLETFISNKSYNPGTQQVIWKANNYQPGMYFFRLTINGKTFNRKFLVE